MAGVSLGIDLGTANIVIASSKLGVVLREPAVIAVDRASGRLLACGREAYAMLGRNPETIRVVRPLQKGVIADYEMASLLLKSLVQKICAYKLIKPRAAVCVPSSATEVEQRSVAEAVVSANVRRVKLIEKAVAAAIGAGLDIGAASGRMVVDLGAGTVDVAVLSLHGVASAYSQRIGGDDMDEAIVRYVRNRYNHIIGLQTAQKLKKQLCSALPLEDSPSLPVPGRDALTGLPCRCTVYANDLLEALHEPLESIQATVQAALEQTPPELSGDVLRDGITLVGGLAQMRGMDAFLTQKTGVPCHMAQHPEDCVAIGTVRSLRLTRFFQKNVYDISQFTSRLYD